MNGERRPSLSDLAEHLQSRIRKHSSFFFLSFGNEQTGQFVGVMWTVGLSPDDVLEELDWREINPRCAVQVQRITDPVPTEMLFRLYETRELANDAALAIGAYARSLVKKEKP